MRVIAGELKGRRLATPKGKDIRPTPEKVKEALFSMLMDRIEGSVVCDLFAGTGALGLEAISRGASYCYFGDRSPESIAMVKENVAHCQVGERCRIILGTYQKTLRSLDGPVDIFFLDPPYGADLLTETITAIAEGGHLSEDGIIVAEHAKDQAMPDTLAGLSKVREKRYGIVVISIYM